jgi:hypothetical protein
LVIGLTGSGKSALCHVIVKPDSLKLNENEGSFEVKEGQKIEIDGRTLFEMSPNLESKTRCPDYHYVAGSEDWFIADTAGAQDNDCEKEYANQTIIYHMMKNAKSFKVVLAFNFSELVAGRGKNFLEMVTQAYRFFNKTVFLIEYLDELEDLIIPLITNQGTCEKKGMLHAEIQKSLDYVDLKLRIMKRA